MNDDLEITYTTSRVDQDCRCCRCGNDDTIANMLKVVWGNDMTVSIKLAVKEDDQYVDYDLTDVEDMVVNVVSPYQDRIQVDSFITANKIQAIIDSNVLESNVPYGIELVWKDGQYDKRAFAKNMFMFVNSSIEATDSAYRYDPQNPYEYNIIMENDTCYISIGQIPEIDLSNYVTQGELTTSLDALWQDCNDTFVDHEELADAISDIDLSSYVSDSELETILENASYVTESSLNTTLSAYVSVSELETILENASYVDQATLSSNSYVTQVSLSSNSYATESYVVDAIAGVTIDESNLVHKTGDESIAGTKTFTTMTISENLVGGAGDLLNSNHQNYVTSKSDMSTSARFVAGEIIAPEVNFNWPGKGQLATAGVIKFSKFNTTNNTTSTIAKIDENGIYEGSTLLENKYLQIANMPSIPAYTSDLVNNSGFLTQSDIDNMSYATESYVTNAISQIPTPDLSSYVKYDDLDAMSYATESYVTNAISNLPLPDLSSYVTLTYLDDNYVSYNELNNYTEAISTALTYHRVDINNTYGYFRNYYTKTESDSRYVTTSQVAANYVDYDSLNNLAYGTSAALNELNDRVTYIEEQGTPDLSSYVTRSEMDATLATYVTYTYLEANYPDYTYLEDALSNISPSVDLSAYVTRSEMDATLATYVSYIDWDNTNEAIAQELTDNRLAHLDINDQFSYYYTKTESDSRYATQSWANNKFVTQSDDVNRQQAIAYAISYLNDNISQGGSIDLSSYVKYTDLESMGYITTNNLNDILANSAYVTQADLEYSNKTSAYVAIELNNRLGYIESSYISQSELSSNSYVSSTYISNIWVGSQNDYDNLIPEQNKLYVII